MRERSAAGGQFWRRAYHGDGGCSAQRGGECGDARCAVVVVVVEGGKKSGGRGCQENKAQGGRMFQTVRV